MDDEGVVRGLLDDLLASVGDPPHPVPGVERRGAHVGGAVPVCRAAQHQAVPVDGACAGGVCHVPGREVSNKYLVHVLRDAYASLNRPHSVAFGRTFTFAVVDDVGRILLRTWWVGTTTHGSLMLNAHLCYLAAFSVDLCGVAVY